MRAKWDTCHLKRYVSEDVSRPALCLETSGGIVGDGTIRVADLVAALVSVL